MAARGAAVLAAAFVLFRIFDILKPPPVRQAERLPTGLGIMADDQVAAAFAAGYAGPLTIEFLSFEPRPVEDKLAEDVVWLRGVLAELGAGGG